MGRGKSSWKESVGKKARIIIKFILDMTIERKAQSCHLSSVNPYLELRKYLNPAMVDPSGIQPSERGAVAQHDLAGVNLDCRSRFQMGERAGHRLDG
jgi:hypothetical protein